MGYLRETHHIRQCIKKKITFSGIDLDDVFFSFSFTFAAVHHAEHTTKAKEKFDVGEKTVLLHDGS